MGKADKMPAGADEGPAQKKQKTGQCSFLAERKKHMRLVLMGMDTRQLAAQRKAGQEGAPTKSVHLLQPNGDQTWTHLLNEPQFINFGLRPEDDVQLLPVDDRFAQSGLHARYLAALQRKRHEHTWHVANHFALCEVLVNGIAIPSFEDIPVDSGDEITVFATTFRVEYW